MTHTCAEVFHKRELSHGQVEAPLTVLACRNPLPSPLSLCRHLMEEVAIEPCVRSPGLLTRYPMEDTKAGDQAQTL